jgi:hypothetical protein
MRSLSKTNRTPRGRLDPRLGVRVLDIRVSFALHTGVLDVAATACPAMTETIAMFEHIDPAILRIAVLCGSYRIALFYRSKHGPWRSLITDRQEVAT